MKKQFQSKREDTFIPLSDVSKIDSLPTYYEAVPTRYKGCPWITIANTVLLIVGICLLVGIYVSQESHFNEIGDVTTQVKDFSPQLLVGKYPGSFVIQHGMVYKFTSIANGGVLEAPNNRVGNGVEIITSIARNDTGVKFLCTSSGNGWRLTSLAKENDRKVLDQHVSNGRLQTWELLYPNKNQEWFFKAVTPDGSVVEILSVANWKAITSHGIGNAATCENLKEGNVGQQWIIQQA